MPGIVSIVSNKNGDTTDIPNRLQQMLQSISHFDDGLIETLLLKNNSIAFGLNSLNIPSFPVQTYSDQEKKVHTIIDGEIVNGQEIRDEFLPDLSIDENGAKLIQILYQRFPDFRFLKKMAGWFNLILYDEPNDRFVIANDRYGIRRLYYKTEDGNAIFSSEVKGILLASPHAKELDNESIANFFVSHGILNDKTLFKDIFRFPPASLWICHRNNWEKTTYWKFDDGINEHRFSENEIFDEFNELFKKIVKRYLKNEYWMSLTGGWDTRTIMSLVQHGQKPQQCFTYGLTRNSAENIMAKKVAKIIDAPHEFITYDDEFIRKFPGNAEKAVWISDGMAQMTTGSILFVHGRHRNKICVQGKFGNQIDGEDIPQEIYTTRRTDSFEMLSKEFYDEIKAWPPQSLEKTINKYKTSDPRLSSDMLFSVYELCRNYWGGNIAVENSMLQIRTPYLDPDLIDFILSVPENFWSLRKFQQYVLGQNNLQLAQLPTDSGDLPQPGKVSSRMLSIFLRTWYYATLICKSRRMPPQLRLDQTFLANNTTAKYANWFRGELKNYLSDIILDNRTMSRVYFDANMLRTMVDEHLNRKKEHTFNIRKIITFELFLRQFVDKN